MRFLFFLAPSLCSLVTPALKRFSSEPGIMYPFGGNVPLMMCESLALATAFRWHLVRNRPVLASPISLATLCKKLWDHPKRSIIASFLVLWKCLVSHDLCSSVTGFLSRNAVAPFRAHPQEDTPAYSIDSPLHSFSTPQSQRTFQ